jgi:hypothetical protein
VTFRRSARALLPQPLLDLNKAFDAESLSRPPYQRWFCQPTRGYKERKMSAIIGSSILMAAAGYSLVYLLLGGGIGGAILIFIVAKMLGK